MYGYEDIRVVHLEIASRCNASCPMCLRNLRGGKTLPSLPLVELSAADAQAIFPADFVSRLSRMYMCGNYGDPVVAKQTIEVLEHFRRHNARMGLRLHTNGSGRPADWWRRLAGTGASCVFAIDGLEDTNPLYRRGTDWDKIMRAAKAFIGAGGWAEWDFLVFRHNERQVQEARRLSEALGFKKFALKRSNRFLRKGRLAKKHPVNGKNGHLQYEIEMPKKREYWNEALVKLGRSTQRSSHDAYLQRTSVSCKVAGEKSLYVTAEGLVFPCCWTAKLYDSYRPGGVGEAWALVEKLPGGKQALNAKRRPLREIVEGPFFRELVPGTWQPGSEARRCSTTCARVCGQFDLMAAQK